MRFFQKKRVLTILSLLVAAVLLFPSISPSVSASEASQADSSSKSSQEEYDKKQKEIEETRAHIKQLEQDIKDGKASAAAAEQRKKHYQNEARLLEEQIVLIQQQITEKIADIDAKILEVAEKQKEYDDNHKLAIQRLRAMYIMNDASVLSTLLAVDSFSDLLTSSKNIQLLSQNDADFLVLLDTQRTELETQQAELENMLVQLEEKNAEMKTKKEEYSISAAKAEAEHSEIMAEVEQSEQDKAQKYEDLMAAERELEQIWLSLGGSAGAYVGGALAWPVPSHNGDVFISSHYGWRTLYGRRQHHNGIDIARGSTSNIHGAAIVAANSGTVVYVRNAPGSKSGYGSYLIIDHGGGVRTYYAHCSSISVSVGQNVVRGETVAAVGNTGDSTGPHLHFELRINNTQHVNPYPYLTGQKEL